MIQKYVVPVLLFLLIAVGLWGWAASEQAKAAQTQAALYKDGWTGEKRAREAIQAAAKKEETVLLARVAKAESLALTNKKVDREVKDAVKANPQWAGAAIPDGVRNALASAGLAHKVDPASGSPAPLP